MAAYRLWRTQFPGPGYPDYHEAMEAEITAIESIDGFAAVSSAQTGGLRASLVAGRRDGHVRAMCVPVAAIRFGRIREPSLDGARLDQVRQQQDQNHCNDPDREPGYGSFRVRSGSLALLRSVPFAVEALLDYHGNSRAKS